MKSPRPHSDAATAAAPFSSRRVVLCVTGGIAAYKAAILTRALVKAGAQVVVVMSEAAQRFVGPLTFETLSGNRVVTSTFERVFDMGAVEHIDLAGWADVVVIAPATYNFIGKLTAGIADDAVTTFVSAVVCPVVIAPAMNEHMWRNPINQRNIAALRALGYRCVDPERGGLACSWEGEGRMAEPETIVEALAAVLAPPARDSLSASVLVTAGGTWEAIDPVRFVGNRASGRMGYALAAAAARRGARVFLVSGPSALEPPPGLAAFRRVESAADMLQACREFLPHTDIVLMAAAVADYRPRHPATAKIKRSEADLHLDLEPAPDVLATLASHKESRLFVGFALETDADPGPAARDKLRRKGLDLVVANRVGPDTGPEQRTNQVWIWNATGLVASTPVLDKEAIADIVIDAVVQERARRQTPAGA